MSSKEKLFKQMMQKRKSAASIESESINECATTVDTDSPINIDTNVNRANKNASIITNRMDSNTNSVSNSTIDSNNIKDKGIDLTIKTGSESVTESDLGFVNPNNADIKNEIESDSKNESSNNMEYETISKINSYRKMVSENVKKKMFDELFIQQNVYIDRNLAKAVDKIVKQKGKKKKDIYNEAIQMYLDIMYDQKIRLKGEEI